MYLKKKVEQEEGKRSFSDSCFYIFHLRMTWSFLLVHSFFCIVQKVRYGFPYLFHWPMFWLITKKENLLKRDWILCGIRVMRRSQGLIGSEKNCPRKRNDGYFWIHKFPDFFGNCNSDYKYLSMLGLEIKLKKSVHL